MIGTIKLSVKYKQVKYVFLPGSIHARWTYDVNPCGLKIDHCNYLVFLQLAMKQLQTFIILYNQYLFFDVKDIDKLN